MISRLADARRIAFQGERGAYSEAATWALVGDDARDRVELLPLRTFDAVFEAVENDAADLGVVPVENSLAGSIHRNYDLLLEHQLYIVAEHNLRVSHCLIGHPGVALAEIKRVYSHPQALAQCEASLAGLPLDEVIAAQDTAGSVQLIKEKGWRDAAAIAGEHAANLYGMDILLREFEDEKTNYTRFLAISKDALQPESDSGWRGEAKTSLAFAGTNEPGLLFRCMSAFALRDIDLTKIESRPLRGVPWEYIFYLDFAGSLSEERCQRALNHLREMASFVRVFGTYARGRTAWAESED